MSPTRRSFLKGTSLAVVTAGQGPGSAGVSAAGLAAIAAIRRADREGWTSAANQESVPGESFLRQGIHRVVALDRRHERITFQEKLDVWRKVGFIPTKKQADIAADLHQIRHVRAGRRSGKTTIAAAEAVAVLVAKPGSFGWVIGPDYGLAWRCWSMIVKMLDKLVALGVVTYKIRQNTPTSMRIELDNGSIIEGQTAEDGDGLQGVGLDFVVLDEIAQIQSWVFLQIIVPAFIQKRGWAFLIGTPLGDSWASSEVRHAAAQAKRTGIESDWAEWLFESWHNTVEFPGGRNDPEILRLERVMSYEDFMEQICARPQRSRYVTYKEFDVNVHVRSFPFNAEMPVQISVDPSTGVNPYAVAAFQDYGEFVVLIDEYYKTSVLASDVANELAQRPWWKNVDHGIMDDAWPQEFKTWKRLEDKDQKYLVNFPMRTAGKSRFIEDSIPLVKQWLRDPLKWNTLTQPIRDRIVGEMFRDKGWVDLDIEDQRQVMVRVEQEADQDQTILAQCARFFVAAHCRNIIDEFATYQHKKPKREEHNIPEKPIDFANHLLDAVRYYLFDRKRHWGLGARALPVSYANV